MTRPGLLLAALCLAAPLVTAPSSASVPPDALVSQAARLRAEIIALAERLSAQDWSTYKGLTTRRAVRRGLLARDRADPAGSVATLSAGPALDIRLFEIQAAPLDAATCASLARDLPRSSVITQAFCAEHGARLVVVGR